MTQPTPWNPLPETMAPPPLWYSVSRTTRGGCARTEVVGAGVDEGGEGGDGGLDGVHVLLRGVESLQSVPQVPRPRGPRVRCIVLRGRGARGRIISRG